MPAPQDSGRIERLYKEGKITTEERDELLSALTDQDVNWAVCIARRYRTDWWQALKLTGFMFAAVLGPLALSTTIVFVVAQFGKMFADMKLPLPVVTQLFIRMSYHGELLYGGTALYALVILFLLKGKRMQTVMSIGYAGFAISFAGFVLTAYALFIPLVSLIQGFGT